VIEWPVIEQLAIEMYVIVVVELTILETANMHALMPEM
jgi:hypothetical protein